MLELQVDDALQQCSLLEAADIARIQVPPEAAIAARVSIAQR